MKTTAYFRPGVRWDMGVQILAEAEQGLAGEGHVLEKLYAALHTQLTPVDKSSDEWLVVNEFMGKSGLSVLDAFAVVGPWDEIPDRIVDRYGAVAERVISYLTVDDLARRPEHLEQWAAVAAAVAAA